MSAAKIARLADRGVVSVTGPDSEKLLQGLVTNDLEGMALGEARHAGLLSPQGKILFDFLIVRTSVGYLLVVAREKASDLVKRLTLYKLRADVAITNVSDSFNVHAVWNGEWNEPISGRGVAFQDPRHRSIGLILLSEAATSFSQLADDGANEDSRAAYDALRVQFSIPEGGKDYEFGDAYPHEANFDLLHGVSFSKGCYVGQEIVARMQNKSVVRKRAIKVYGNAPFTAGAEIMLGNIPVGRIGTVDGSTAIAMLRLDRVIEAEEKGTQLVANGISLTADNEAVDRYRASAAARSQGVLPAS
jgi:tRNA-modifying protein YgfZ